MSKDFLFFDIFYFFYLVCLIVAFPSFDFAINNASTADGTELFFLAISVTLPASINLSFTNFTFPSLFFITARASIAFTFPSPVVSPYTITFVSSTTFPFLSITFILESVPTKLVDESSFPK